LDKTILRKTTRKQHPQDIDLRGEVPSALVGYLAHEVLARAPGRANRGSLQGAGLSALERGRSSASRIQREDEHTNKVLRSEVTGTPLRRQSCSLGKVLAIGETGTRELPVYGRTGVGPVFDCEAIAGVVPWRKRGQCGLSLWSQWNCHPPVWGVLKSGDVRRSGQDQIYRFRGIRTLLVGHPLRHLRFRCAHWPTQERGASRNIQRYARNAFGYRAVGRGRTCPSRSNSQ
jgi:hypothetical protein